MGGGPGHVEPPDRRPVTGSVLGGSQGAHLGGGVGAVLDGASLHRREPSLDVQGAIGEAEQDLGLFQVRRVLGPRGEAAIGVLLLHVVPVGAGQLIGHEALPAQGVQRAVGTGAGLQGVVEADAEATPRRFRQPPGLHLAQVVHHVVR